MEFRINIFISHSWKYSTHYDTLYTWIFDEQWNSEGNTVKFVNFSVPKDDPIHNPGNEYSLKQAIDSKMRQASVVIIPTGMYAEYSYWIGKEIDIANKYKKKILGVNLRGSLRHSSTVMQHATKTVNWQKNSVVSGIWDLR